MGGRKMTSPMNVFHSAAKKKTKGVATETVSVVKSSTQSTARTKENQTRLDELTARMTTLNQDIEAKIESISKEKGLTKQQIWIWLSNNISKEDWDRFSKDRGAFNAKVMEVIGRPSTLKNVKESNTAVAKASETSTRKGQSVAVRHKNWISTR
jgi:hypothetical protein